MKNISRGLALALFCMGLTACASQEAPPAEPLAMPGNVSVPRVAVEPFKDSDPLPPQVRLPGSKDELGLPLRADTGNVVEKYGPAIARSLASDDRSYCGDLSQLQAYLALHEEIVKREEDLHAVEDKLRARTSELDRKILEAERDQLKFQIADLVLSGVQIGLGFLIDAPAAYQALIAVGGVQNGLRGINSIELNRLFLYSLEIHNAWMKDYGDRMEQYHLEQKVSIGLYGTYMNLMLHWCQDNGHISGRVTVESLPAVSNQAPAPPPIATRAPASLAPQPRRQNLRPPHTTTPSRQ